MSTMRNSAAAAFWGVDGDARPAVSFDVATDVCVIGGGVAGLTVARDLALRGRDVALIEARQIGWNASGHHLGIVSPGYASSLRRIAERVGLSQAKALWSLSASGMRRLRAQLDVTPMPGVSVAPGWLRVYRSDDPDALAARVELMRDTFELNVTGWDGEQTRARLNSARYAAAIHFEDAFSIEPKPYLAGLAAQAVEAGARLFENTPATVIDAVGIRKRVVTPGATIRSSQIVLAGNAHLGAALPRLSETLVRLWGHAALFAPGEDRLRASIDYAGAVSDGGIAGNHYRATADGQLAWSGHVTARRLNSGTAAARLRRDMGRIFPALRGAALEQVAQGEMGLPIHLMPQIGELAPGLWVATGFGGHGLNISALAGDLVSSGIVDQDDRWRLFVPFELAWSGGALGRVAAASVVVWRRWRDSRQGRMAAVTRSATA